MSKNESERCHFTHFIVPLGFLLSQASSFFMHFIVALGFLLSQAYSATKGFFKSLKPSPTTPPCQDQPHGLVIIDIPAHPLPPSSGYITTQEYQDQPHYGFDISINNLPPSSSATQDHHDQPQPHYVLNSPTGWPSSSSATQDHHDQPRGPHYVQLDAPSSVTLDHHDQQQPYYDHNDQPRPRHVLDTPAELPSSSSEYIATHDNHDQPRPHYVLDAPSSATQDHHDQPRPHYVLDTRADRPSSSFEYTTTQDHHDQPRGPHYVQLDAPSSITQGHHAQPQPYYDHNDQPRPRHVLDTPAELPSSSSEYIVTHYNHDQPRPHDVLDAPSSATQDHHDQPRPHTVLDTPADPPSSSLEYTTTQDHHDQPRGPDAPAGSPPSSVSGSIHNDSNYTVVAPPNATNNSIWQQIEAQNLGKVVLALAAAVFSQYKDLTDQKDGWVAIALLFGVAAIWNGLLFRRMYLNIASMMEKIGMVFVFAALSGLACHFTPQINKHSIIPLLFCASMCLPILCSV